MPSTRALPEVGESSPPRMLMSVVLPEPEGPMMAIHSPSSMVKETPSRAQTLPKSLRRFSIWTTEGMVLAGTPVDEKKVASG